jgi:hypothetical protein
MRGACSRYGGHDTCIQGFAEGDMKERDYLEDLGLDGRIILKRIFKTWDWEACTGLICLRAGTGGGRF